MCNFAAVDEKPDFHTPRHLKPSVRKVCKVYRKGVSVAKQAMQDIEARLERTEGLEDWFIKIVPQPQTG